MKYPHFKGVKNYLFEDAKLLYFVEQTLQKIAQQHSFVPIQTSLINHKGVFLHSLGETSDIVNKELCYIQKQDYLLRPEGTSNVINALLQQKCFRNQHYPFKISYTWDMFRYENPQKGRYRQFRQFGIELINKYDDNFQDFYALQIADQCIKSLGLENEVQLQINYIGDIKNRDEYNYYIKQYFNENLDQYNKLSDKGKEQVNKNGIKLFDTKNQSDKDLLNNLKPFQDFIEIEKLQQYEQMKNMLRCFNIDFRENRNLIRGLDYYSGLCYEYLIKQQIDQSQNAILGGGRYDKLINKLTDQKIELSCVGFAIGINRILDHYEFIIREKMNEFEKQNKTVGLVFLDIDFNKNIELQMQYKNIISQLHPYQIDLQITNQKKFGKTCRYYEQQNIPITIVIGREEFENQNFQIKNLKNQQQTTHKIEDLCQILKQNF